MTFLALDNPFGLGRPFQSWLTLLVLDDPFGFGRLYGQTRNSPIFSSPSIAIIIIIIIIVEKIESSTIVDPFLTWTQLDQT